MPLPFVLAFVILPILLIAGTAVLAAWQGRVDRRRRGSGKEPA